MYLVSETNYHLCGSHTKDLPSTEEAQTVCLWERASVL